VGPFFETQCSVASVGLGDQLSEILRSKFHSEFPDTFTLYTLYICTLHSLSSVHVPSTPYHTIGNVSGVRLMFVYVGLKSTNYWEKARLAKCTRRQFVALSAPKNKLLPSRS